MNVQKQQQHFHSMFRLQSNTVMTSCIIKYLLSNILILFLTVCEVFYKALYLNIIKYYSCVCFIGCTVYTMKQIFSTFSVLCKYGNTFRNMDVKQRNLFHIVWKFSRLLTSHSGVTSSQQFTPSQQKVLMLRHVQD